MITLSLTFRGILVFQILKAASASPALKGLARLVKCRASLQGVCEKVSGWPRSLPTMAQSQSPLSSHLSRALSPPGSHSSFHSCSQEVCVAFLTGASQLLVPAKQTHQTVLSLLRTHRQCHLLWTRGLHRGVSVRQTTGLQNMEALSFLYRS